jgi:predicted transcriptional regulator
MPYELNEIKKIRKSAGITQKELAKQANVSQSLIAKIESDKIDPSYSKAKKIFDTLTLITHKSELKAKDIMNKRVISVKSNCTIKEAIRLMKKYEISQLPVIDRHLIGLVSESSIVDHIGGVEKEVKNIMGEIPPIISKEENINLIAGLLKYSSIVLVMDNGIKGVITKSDLIRKISKI